MRASCDSGDRAERLAAEDVHVDVRHFLPGVGAAG